jgi:hypothetical protein
MGTLHYNEHTDQFYLHILVKKRRGGMRWESGSGC